jgi:hypothetical protein
MRQTMTTPEMVQLAYSGASLGISESRAKIFL